MNLVHLVPHIDAEAAGPSYSVPRLCQSIAERGHEVTLSCSVARQAIPGVVLQEHRHWLLERIALSPSHVFALRRAADSADIIHNHSLWAMVNVAAGWTVPGRRAKLVTSPRGTLSRWALARHQRRKRLVWPLQDRVLKRADLLHATSDEEYADIRRLGLLAPVLIARNGVDVPELRLREVSEGPRVLLFLSRVHPVKGLENLLDAWPHLERLHPDWRLRIVGPGDSAYVAALRARVGATGARNVEFAGPLYGAAKHAAYRGADLFVLPTHSENFGMAVAEALANECPVVVSHGAPWAGVDSAGCGWWISNNVDSLRFTLSAAMSLPSTVLWSMGRKGRAWMQRDFSWQAVAATMEAGYRWLLEGGVPPDCVRTE